MSDYDFALRVSVLAEFVGGPLDGELREMPDGRPEWRFPYRPYMSSAVAVLAETPNARIEHHELIYRRSALRLLNDQSGGRLVVRYLFRSLSAPHMLKLPPLRSVEAWDSASRVGPEAGT